MKRLILLYTFILINLTGCIAQRAVNRRKQKMLEEYQQTGKVDTLGSHYDENNFDYDKAKKEILNKMSNTETAETVKLKEKQKKLDNTTKKLKPISIGSKIFGIINPFL